MILRLKKNTLILFSLYLSIISVVIFFNHTIQSWHESNFAFWFSSDGSEYYRLYEVYSSQDLPIHVILRLFIVGFPVLLLLFFNGSVASVIIFSNSIFFISLFLYCKALRVGNPLVIIVILLMPPIFFGLFSINKEIYLISGTLLFISYYISGSSRLLIFSFFVMMMSRSYMLVFFVFIMILFPRGREVIDYKRIFISMFSISLLSPAILHSGYFGTSENLLDGAGALANFFASGIRHGIYIVLYFPKFFFLIFMRVWSAYVDGLFGFYQANLRDLLLSLYSVIIISLSLYRLHKYKSYRFRYLVIAFLSPYPLMFSDIAHWRYYIFSLPFFITYVFLNDSYFKNYKY
ncbi:hypothetical protein JGK47_002538 [Vibrio metoecus]